MLCWKFLQPSGLLLLAAAGHSNGIGFAAAGLGSQEMMLFAVPWQQLPALVSPRGCHGMEWEESTTMNLSVPGNADSNRDSGRNISHFQRWGNSSAAKLGVFFIAVHTKLTPVKGSHPSPATTAAQAPSSDCQVQNDPFFFFKSFLIFKNLHQSPFHYWGWVVNDRKSKFETCQLQGFSLKPQDEKLRKCKPPHTSKLKGKMVLKLLS